MQADLLNEILKQNDNYEQDDFFSKDLTDASEFDFWAASPQSPFCPTQVSLPDEEKISKFFKLQIFQTNTLKVNSEELLNKCLTILRTQTLSEQNQVLFLKLLSSLSTSHSSADIIRSTGLLKWVEQHSQSDSPKFFLESWKILQNLSAHATNAPVYLDGVYPFNPPWIIQKPVADVVLVHGIKGGAAWTWRQHDELREKYPVLTQKQRQELLTNPFNQSPNQNLADETYTWIWPLDWLSQRIEQPFRIVAVDYPAHWWEWFDEPGNQKRDLTTLSEETILKLKASGVGSRPIIWIAHSMGGILVKRIFQLELMDAHVILIIADCPRLMKIHQDFIEFCERKSLKVLTLNENQPCKITRNGPNFTFVPSKYGNPGIGEFYEVDASHLDICKPKGRLDEKFKLIEGFLSNIFEKLTDR